MAVRLAAVTYETIRLKVIRRIPSPRRLDIYDYDSNPLSLTAKPFVAPQTLLDSFRHQQSLAAGVAGRSVLSHSLSLSLSLSLTLINQSSARSAGARVAKPSPSVRFSWVMIWAALRSGVSKQVWPSSIRVTW
jgi:hypothetical protein